MMASEVTTRASSDAEFDQEALCIHCSRSVRREAGDHAVHPALAIATDDTGYDFQRAVTLCSACLDRAGLDTCQLAAMDRVRDFDGLRFRFQLVGTAEQRTTLQDFVDVLDFLTAVLEPMPAAPRGGAETSDGPGSCGGVAGVAPGRLVA
jgi:hypothetical protein